LNPRKKKKKREQSYKQLEPKKKEKVTNKLELYFFSIEPKQQILSFSRSYKANNASFAEETNSS